MILGLVLALQAASGTSAGLSALSRFAGACWIANFTPTTTDTHCFEAMYGGAHVRDRHQVRASGKVVYAGETIYSLDGDNMVFTYFNSLGGVGHGTMQRDGSTLRFKGSMRGSPKDAEQPIDSEWHVIDRNHYEVRSFSKSTTSQQDKPLTFTRLMKQSKP